MKTFMILMLVLLMVAACGGDSSSPATAPQDVAATSTINPDEPVELIVWGLGENQFIADAFEARHPGVTVILENRGWDQELFQNVQNALAAGTPPDVIIGESYFLSLINQAELLPLDLDGVQGLLPGTYQGAIGPDGTVYGLAHFTGLFVLERNCAVITAAGLDCDQPPATWDELLNHARQITQDETYGYALQGPVGPVSGAVLRLAVFLAQAEAEICQGPECSQPYFDNPELIPVLEFLRELHQYTPPGLSQNPEEGQVYTELFLGRVGYQIAGSWHPGWARDTGCEDCRYSLVPVPEGGEQATILVGNAIFAAMAETPYPDLARDFVLFAGSDPDIQARVFEETGRLPVTRPALEALQGEVDAATADFIAVLLDDDTTKGILPRWSADPQQVWQVFNDELLSPVLFTNEPIPDILADAQAAAQALEN